MVAEGKVIGKLYILDNSSIVDFLSCNSSKTCKDSKATTFVEKCNMVKNKNKDVISVWHRKLGHSSHDVLSHLDFISVKYVSRNEPCVPCHHAKQHKFPFENSESVTDGIFQLIHVDLWGPYKSKTITGASFFLTIVDDYSRAT